jgi:isopenicillin N synthase-like dioxygenase
VVPLIDIEPLFGGPSPARDRTDLAIATAANESGFFTIEGPSDHVPTTVAQRQAMLRVFALDADQQRSLWRNFYEPTNPNIYRGWNPRNADVGVDIFDMGPDVIASRTPLANNDDPLLGATPFPLEESLPGWRNSVSAYYIAMESLGAAIMRSVARSLGVDEHHFDAAFREGISTLRVMRYELHPVDPADELAADLARGMPRRGEHVDSGFVTLLCQHGVAGLEAKLRTGDWINVPPIDGHLAVNFGGLLERWTEGRIRATPHRVVSHGATRFSIPFFYEPRADAVIAPLPIPGASTFEPFSYGDHLWSAMSKFPNFTGVADLRKPRGVGSGIP